MEKRALRREKGDFVGPFLVKNGIFIVKNKAFSKKQDFFTRWAKS